MKEYKKRQVFYHKTTVVDDHIDQIQYKVKKSDDFDLINEIIAYFVKDQEVVVFPAKSYSVAIIYSFLIAKYFKEDVYEVLSDAELFLDTDKFFTPYLDHKLVYDQVVEYLDKNLLLDFENSTIYNVRKTVEYFKDEFFL